MAGWPRQLLPSFFLSGSVVWTRLGYFLGDGTTLHLRVELRCMHHTEHDCLERWTDDDCCWVCVGLVNVCVRL